MGQTSDFWELVDSNADVAPAGRGRVRLKGGVIQQSVNGGAWSTIGGGDVPLPAGVINAVADGASLTATFSGEVAGGIEVTGLIQTGTASGGGAQDVIYGLLPNGLKTNTTSNNGAGSGPTSANKGFTFYRMSTGVSRLFGIVFRMPVTQTNRGPRYWQCEINDTAGVIGTCDGYWLDETTPLTSLVFLAQYVDGSTSVFTNIVKVIPGYAGPSYIAWAAQGRP